jgi:hypothetical protein
MQIRTGDSVSPNDDLYNPERDGELDPGDLEYPEEGVEIG